MGWMTILPSLSFDRSTTTADDECPAEPPMCPFQRREEEGERESSAPFRGGVSKGEIKGNQETRLLSLFSV